MSYRPRSGLTLGRATVLVGWTLLVAVLLGVFLFPFTFGDCGDETVCQANSARAGNTIICSGIGAYWIGFILLVRRWSRS
jgi:hypothetical protein